MLFIKIMLFFSILDTRFPKNVPNCHKLQKCSILYISFSFKKNPFTAPDNPNESYIGKGQLPNMQRGSAQDTDGNQAICPEELLSKEVSGSPFEEFPAYLQKIKLTHNSWPSEESVNKLLVAVECKNTEILDQLWRDYRSGHLNVVAEKFLLTDDIKRRFHLKSVKFKTTILEEDYLACKAFLSNNSSELRNVLKDG